MKKIFLLVMFVTVLCLGGCGEKLTKEEELDYSVFREFIKNYPFDRIPSEQELDEWYESNGWEKCNIEWDSNSSYDVESAVNNGWVVDVTSYIGENGMYTFRNIEVHCRQEDVETIFASCNSIMEELYGEPRYIAEKGSGYDGDGCEYQLVMSMDEEEKDGYVTISSLYPPMYLD